MSTIIGSNIRPGMCPGGHTKHLYASTRAITRKKTTATDVMKAAKAALERRGMHNAPTYVRDGHWMGEK